MNPRHLFLIGAASLLIPISSSIAFAKTQLAPTDNQALNSTVAQMSENPPPQMGEGQQGDGFAPPPPGGGRGERGGNGEPPWAKEVNLSSEQKESIKQIHEQAKKDMEPLRTQLMEAEKQMRSLLASDTSPEQLRKQHQNIQTLRQKMDNKHFEIMLSERQVLTSQQRTQLEKLMQQHQGKRPQLQQR